MGVPASDRTWLKAGNEDNELFSVNPAGRFPRSYVCGSKRDDDTRPGA